MKKLFGFVVVFLLSTAVHADSVAAADANEIRIVTSPPHRVALLELYTSEGCSSCPPADRFLSNLRQSGVSEQQIIPLAFHVTYWDYIGWKDVYGQDIFDLRQRALGRNNRLSTIYTPQFVMAGKDFRRYRKFSDDINKINAQQAEVDLSLALNPVNPDTFDVQLAADTKQAKASDVALFLAVVESGLTTHVEDGENEGKTLKHDYVVRELHGPVFVSRPDINDSMQHRFRVQPGWKKASMNVVGFAQNLHTGKVLQAVSMELVP